MSTLFASIARTAATSIMLNVGKKRSRRVYGKEMRRLNLRGVWLWRSRTSKRAVKPLASMPSSVLTLVISGRQAGGESKSAVIYLWWCAPYMPPGLEDLEATMPESVCVDGEGGRLSLARCGGELGREKGW